MEDTSIKTSDIKGDLQLRYANGEISTASELTTRLNCNVQNKTFLQRFVVSDKPLPGVDAVIGLRFLQEHKGILSWEGPNDDQPISAFQMDGNGEGIIIPYMRIPMR